MPKRKISSGAAPLQPNCSDGAKMLIDQMKEHPEDFRGYGGKFAGMLELAQEVQRGATRNMSKRDAEAVVEAAQTHLFEVWLAEDVLTKMMAPKPEPETSWGTTTGRSVNQLGIWQGAVPPGSVITTNSIANTTLACGSVDSNIAISYEEHMRRMMQEKYRSEMDKLRQEDIAHAQRSTTPLWKLP